MSQLDNNKSNVIQFPGTHSGSNNNQEKPSPSAAPIPQVANLESLRNGVPTQQADFRAFVLAAMSRRADIAGKILTDILGLSPQGAEKAGQYFIDQMRIDPNFMEQAMQLRVAVQNNTSNEGILLLLKCFNIKGPKAILVWETIKNKLT